MSQYYKVPRGADWNYGGPKWKLSRSKIDLFFECPRCFYLDNKLGVKRPPGFPFNLNSAVDALLKKEFDVHRAEKTSHPLMKEYGIKAVPFVHKKMDEWRENFKGVQYHHEPTDFVVTGAVDDLWENEDGSIAVVDYKATSKTEEVNIDAPWQISYKRQMEVYQWLLRQNQFNVSDTGYFVYCNGDGDKEAFDGKLEFSVKVIPYEGDDSWMEAALYEMKELLDNPELPKASPECDYCRYHEVVLQKEFETGDRGKS